MFTKLTINNVVITETHTNAHTSITDTTNVKIDNISFEDNCTASECIKVLEAAINIFNNKQKKTKEEGITNKFLITVFKFNTNDKVKFAIIEDQIEKGKYYKMNGNGLINITKKIYDDYQNQIETGMSTRLRKFYADWIPAYEDL